MHHPLPRLHLAALAFAVLTASTALAQAPPTPPAASPPAWMNTTLSADQRADLVLAQMTLDEKITMLHGTSGAPLGTLGAGSAAAQSNGGAGMFGGVARLGIPPIQMADASYGVTHGRQTGRYSTALPSTLAATASWDTQLAFDYGALIGKELRAHGYNMSLGGGVNLTREPRNGRTFEYQGEDPLLAGTMVGHTIRGVQAQHILGDIKHFALNDQESGRNAVDITIDERALRETDLRAFEIGIAIGHPNAVMCSYNRVAGDYACENKHLMQDILKTDWHFDGFVLSDWGGTHSTAKSLAAGLDNEEPNSRYFGEPLRKAVDAKEITEADINEHVHRILRSQFASGVIDFPIERNVVDVDAGLIAAQTAAEQGIVLLQNRDHLLPLDPAKIHTLVVIGAHADIAMISGGGSAQVDPPGGNAIPAPIDPNNPRAMFVTRTWFPQSPLRALQARFPGMKITFDSGDNPARAAAAAKAADAAIVFGWQWESEAMDLDSLALSDDQNALIAAVTAANPRSVVVLETGGAVLMPWAPQASAIVEAWYAGSRGATAVARILAGDVNPSAKLPLTFPLADADLPHPTLVKPGPDSRPLQGQTNTAMSSNRTGRVLAPFPVAYDEGLKVGYAWYDAEKKPVLFPFGFGLSYTAFAYSALQLTHTADTAQITFTLTNKGKRAGAEIAEVYAALPASANEPPKRLVGWAKVSLAPGQSRSITIPIDARALSVYDVATHSWFVPTGDFQVMVGGSSQALPLSATVALGTAKP